MKLYSLNIKDKNFKVGVISDAAAMKKGLAGTSKLGKNKGLMFDFGKEQSITMNMVKMNYPLDMIFINMQREVVAVRTLSPGNFDTTVKGARFVVEVNKGEASGLVGEKIQCNPELAKAVGMVPCGKKHDEENTVLETDMDTTDEGDSMPITKGTNIIVRVSMVPEESAKIFKKGGKLALYEEDVAIRKDAMQVLDDTGKVLMNIIGGERIFSIEHTEQLVSLAKKVDNGEAPSSELGRLMSRILHIQDTQAPQYV